MVYNIFEKYKKIISLTILLCVTIIITYIIKYYFRPFLAMIFIFIIASPL
ncbi:AI-2E family transporter, partial [Clostridium botulinum]|nr:AI-2E family transporter [Clostridium botulinum]